MESNDFKKFLREKERDCCKVNPPSETNSNGCIQSWKEEIKAAKIDYTKASANAEKAQGIYSIALEWELKLRAFMDNADKAHDETSETYRELLVFQTATKRLSRTTELTRDAVQPLLCLLKRIFENIDKLLFAVESDQGSTGNGTVDSNLIPRLKESIKCNTKLDEQKKQAALECIHNYEVKTIAVNLLQIEIVRKILELLNHADLIAAHMKDKKFGLSWQIDDLVQRLLGKKGSLSKAEACRTSQSESNSNEFESNLISPPCNSDIERPPKDRQLLPIKDLGGTGKSQYYFKIEELYQNAKKKLNEYEVELNKQRDIREKAFARKTSLTDAIIAAEAAEVAK